MTLENIRIQYFGYLIHHKRISNIILQQDGDVFEGLQEWDGEGKKGGKCGQSRIRSNSSITLPLDTEMTYFIKQNIIVVWENYTIC